MKLRNGFGSHRYVYSPILLDSQDLILFYLSTRSSCHAGCAPESCYYYTYHATLIADGEWRWIRLPSQLPAAGPAPGIYTLPLGLASVMENGDPFATCILSWDAAPAPGYYSGKSCELGNGEWRRMRCTCCQGCGTWCMFICQLGEGQWAMEPMDGATIPGKMYSKL